MSVFPFGPTRGSTDRVIPLTVQTSAAQVILDGFFRVPTVFLKAAPLRQFFLTPIPRRDNAR